MARKITLKQILTDNQAWWNFQKEFEGKLRKAIKTNIVKVLSCKNPARGYQKFQCSDSKCTHSKKVFFTCKSRLCSSCGRKATADWINKQLNILPDVSWQHITFTMPDALWDFFAYNRELLNIIPKLAAQSIKKIAKDKKVTPGIFIAIHTFGRDLKFNVHIHLSVTLGGLSNDKKKWKTKM